ncbi:MAG TPA: class I SAM-dependent methyltransferase, partial [Candidatus Acidoferrales bacterium]|nr:class I SAM-dependent methyltransferase [Candidatus Acidoferrales bacterium]
ETCKCHRCGRNFPVKDVAKAYGEISHSGENYLGIDRTGRVHWRKRPNTAQMSLFGRKPAAALPIHHTERPVPTERATGSAEPGASLAGTPAEIEAARQRVSQRRQEWREATGKQAPYSNWPPPHIAVPERALQIARSVDLSVPLPPAEPGNGLVWLRASAARAVAEAVAIVDRVNADHSTPEERVSKLAKYWTVRSLGSGTPFPSGFKTRKEALAMAVRNAEVVRQMAPIRVDEALETYDSYKPAELFSEDEWIEHRQPVYLRMLREEAEQPGKFPPQQLEAVRSDIETLRRSYREYREKLPHLLEKPAMSIAKGRPLRRLGRWFIAKATQLGLFGDGNIKHSPENHLGVDRRGRTHWIANRSRLGMRVPLPVTGELFVAAPPAKEPAAPAVVSVRRVQPHDFDILSAWDKLTKEGQDKIIRGFDVSREKWESLPRTLRVDALNAALGGSVESAKKLVAEHVVGASPSAEASTLATRIDSGPQPDPKTAAKLRAVADRLGETINHYQDPAISHQNVTARRSRIAAGMALEGDRLEGVQAVLYALADMHENGTITPELANVKSKAFVELLLSRRPYVAKDGPNKGIPKSQMPRLQIDSYQLRRLVEATAGKRLGSELREKFAEIKHRQTDEYDNIPLTPDEVETVEAVAKLCTTGSKWDAGGAILDRLKAPKKAIAAGLYSPEKWDSAANQLAALRKVTDRSAVRRVQELERHLIGMKIPGYFPTPIVTVEKLLELADIEPGMEVLEPSAGKGNIADVIREKYPTSPLSVIEYSQTLAGVLEAKGYRPVGSDFMEFNGQYDRIVMNPPWGKEVSAQDTDHVMHAYDCLKPGGRLVAIMGEHAFFANDAKAVAFRAWLYAHGGIEEKLPPKSFMSSERPTGVNVRVVVVDKPGSPPLRFGEEVEGLPESAYKDVRGKVWGVQEEQPEYGGQKIKVQGHGIWAQASDFRRVNSEREEIAKALFYLEDEDLPVADDTIRPALERRREALRHRYEQLNHHLEVAV